MITVHAVVWYWTPEGMRNQPAMRQGLGMEGFITRREAERLLEEAYRAGARAARDEAMEVVRRTGVG